MFNFVNISNDGGVSKQLISDGAGSAPPAGAKVQVHYVGTLQSDGTQFDSSRQRGEPFAFTLGAGEVIRGWDIGVASMRQGERAVLRCEPDYAYGASGSPPAVPPAATLLFDVELLDWQPPEPETVPEQLEAANGLKEAGNAHFKHGRYSAAVASYERAIDLFRSTARTASGDELRLIDAVRLSCLLNLAACHLKLEDAARAAANAEKALDIEPANVKALYRLGAAQAAAGRHEAAKATLTKAAKLSPQSAEIRQELQKLLDQEKAHKEKERQMFGKLFSS